MRKKSFGGRNFKRKKKRAAAGISILLSAALSAGMPSVNGMFAISAAAQGEETDTWSEMAEIVDGDVNGTEFADGDEDMINSLDGSPEEGELQPEDVETPEADFEYYLEGKKYWIMSYKGSAANVVIPATYEGIVVKGIWSGAFKNNTTIESVTLPESITEIRGSAFQNCTSLKTIIIPDSVQSIGFMAFQSCSALQSVSIRGVTQLSEYAFRQCESLRQVDMPSSLKEIPAYVFGFCKNLESVTIPEGVESIGEAAFSQCESLISVEIPDSVETIGETAFSGCNSLVSVKLPSGLKEIPDQAFSNCKSLTSIELPDGITLIGTSAFSSCAFTSVKIPDGVTAINNMTFFGCKNLESIELPDGITSIGRMAFCECRKLASVCIPESVTSIDTGAFEWCESLTAVEIPMNVETVGQNAFLYADPSSVLYPDGLDLSAAGLSSGSTSKVAYQADGDGNVVVNRIELGSMKGEVEVPDEIAGHPVLLVAEEFRDMVSESGHTHRGGVTTCTDSAHCVICNAEYRDFEVREHQYDKVRDNNDGTHNRICSVCEDAQEEACVYEYTTVASTADGHTGTCEVCGHLIEIEEHTYGDWTKESDTRYTRDCSICEYDTSAVINVLSNEVTAEYGRTGEEKLTVEVEGAKAAYQWSLGEEEIDGATTASLLLLEDLTPGTYTYQCRVTPEGSQENSVFSIAVEVVPAIPQIMWSTTVQEVEYTGSAAKILVPTVTLIGNDVFDGTIRYSYKMSGSDVYSSGLPVDAGTYIIRAEVEAAGYYAAAESKNTLTLIIKEQEAETTPTPGEEISPTPGTEITPTPGTEITPTPGTEITPTPGAENTPTPGAEITPTPGVETTPTPGAEITPTPGIENTPTPGAENTPTPGAGSTPTPGTEITPTPGAGNMPTPGMGSTPTPGPENTPTPGTEATPTPGTEITPTPETKATPTPEAETTPTPGAEITPYPGTETRPDSGKPFIREESGTQGIENKIGWTNIVNETDSAKDGSRIVIDMNKTTIVPEDMLECICGKNITIIFDLGDGILWSVDGESIASDRIGEIDFSVKTGTDAVPAKLVERAAGEYYSMQLSLAHEGAFGFTAFLGINLGEENAELIAILYYYNAGTGELERISTAEIAPDGMAWLEFTHASDYLIVVEREKNAEDEKIDKETGEEEEDGRREDKTGEGENGKGENGEESTNGEDENGKDENGEESGNGKDEIKEESGTGLPKTGLSWSGWQFLLLGAVIFLAGFGIISDAEKKKGKCEKH